MCIRDRSVYVHSYISQGSLVMTPSETIIQPGAQATFTTSFVMPGNDVAVGFAPAYKVDDTWLVGTGISKTIALEVEEPPEVPPEAPTFSEFAISDYRVLVG